VSYRIWKYLLEVTDRQTIRLPARAQGLSVLVLPQEGVPFLYLYAFVDPDQPEAAMTIRIIGTGNPIDTPPSDFIGTVSLPPHVWHVFKE
jgi:hypothetical protein